MTEAHPRARRRVPTGLALLCALSAGGAARAQGSDPTGLWRTESGVSTVRIARCGGGYCGVLAATGGSGLDANNPDPGLRGRRLVGVQILEARTPSGAGFEGTLYNPNDGKTYSGSLTPQGPDRLEVSGCVLRVLCRQQTWTRVR